MRRGARRYYVGFAVQKAERRRLRFAQGCAHRGAFARHGAEELGAQGRYYLFRTYGVPNGVLLVDVRNGVRGDKDAFGGKPAKGVRARQRAGQQARGVRQLLGARFGGRKARVRGILEGVARRGIGRAKDKIYFAQKNQSRDFA